MMVRGTIFYNPKDKECKEIQKIVNRKSNCDFTFLDATSKNISSHLYRDMNAESLPILYFYHKNSYKIYEGCDRIKLFLSSI